MVTFINIFTVKPEKQQQALKNINQIYQEVVSNQPGFISAELLQSNDGVRVTAIARWENQQNLSAMLETEDFKALHNQEFMQEIESFEPRFYATAVEVKPGDFANKVTA